MGESAPPGREPFRLRCAACQHVSTAAYLPMEAMAFAALVQGAHCPMCGADSRRLFMAAAPHG